MAEVVPVEENGVTFYVEVKESPSGAEPAGLADRFDLSGVSETIGVVASQMQRAWAQTKPDEATIEFGIDVTAKSGKLTGILVEGEGKASLKVTLVWKDHKAEPTP